VDLLNLQTKAPSCYDQVHVSQLRLRNQLKNYVGNMLSVQGVQVAIQLKQYE